MKDKSLFMAARLLLILVFFSISIFSQPYPDTILVPVTFFDFHSTFHPQVNHRACPEFNPRAGDVFAVTGMVRNRLDSDGLPVRGSKISFSYYIENWYRSSAAGEQTVTDRFPRYNYPNGRHIMDDVVNYNPFENIKILDTLTFRHVGNGTYEFRDDAFFPLDRQGFGNEPTWNYNGDQQLRDHNYSFTMMLETEFIYRKGLSFRFIGDDDVWVFIKDQLVLDLGGIHSAVEGEFELNDNLANQLGLELNKTYVLSFFFAERQADESHIWITTNIISILPENLEISVEPSDTIYVGDTLTAIAAIKSDTGLVNIGDLPGDLTWGFLDLYANNHDSTFTPLQDSLVFIPTEAWTTVRIWAIYTDAANNIVLKDTVEIVVLPGPPDHLVIEASPDKPQDQFLWDDNPLDRVTINQNEEYNDRFYAILRDKYGNWISPADPIKTWTSKDITIVTAEEGPNPDQGQGKANRASWSKSGTTDVTGTYDYNGNLLSDDIEVIVQGEKFPVLSATYYETDDRPDGLIDMINVVVDERLDVSEPVLDVLFTTVSLPSSRNFTYNRDDFIATNDGFKIRVTQPSNTTPYTAVDSQEDILTISESQLPNIGVIPATTLAIHDSLGPVITSATFCPRNEFNNDTIPDSLMVSFSEDIVVPSSKEPFAFYNISPPNNTYSMILSPLTTANGKDMNFLVEKSAKPYPEKGDSIWIVGGNHIEDIQPLFQERDTKPVPLQVKPYPLVLTIAVLSPVSISDPTLDPDLVKTLKLGKNNEGSVITIEISGYVEDPEIWSGQLTLYDPLGNTVTQDIYPRFVTYIDNQNITHNVLVFVWDLSNTQGRIVGPSAYKGTVEIKKRGKTFKTYTIFIGVKS